MKTRSRRHPASRLALCGLLGLCGLLSVLAADEATPADGPSMAHQPLRSQVEELRQDVLGPDPDAACEAARELSRMGPSQQRILAVALRTVLARDKAVVDRAITGDLSRLRRCEEKLVEQRSAALANIRNLEKGSSIDLAREHFGRLQDLLSQLEGLYSLRTQIGDVLDRRTILLPLYRQAAPADDGMFNDAAEAKLTTVAEKTMGMTAAAEKAVGDMSQAPPPQDGSAKHLWFHRSCRKIEEYNQTAFLVMGLEEMKNLRMVNRYRECLGILPLEADARLVQSARRHSREMEDLGYFSHDSPTASQRSHVQRMKNAGYDGGYSENIAGGARSGEKAFWMWFESPGHHKNMVSGASAIGIGRWRNTWTQNFGAGSRLMLLSLEQRSKIKVLGTILLPEPDTGQERGR